MSKLRYACLFSGIGSPLQGAFRVYGKENIEHIFSCEYDKFARQSFNAIYNIDEAHFHKDVHDLDGTQYRDTVDILIGGSPCQAFSIAGLRNGTDDERGQLIYQYIRIVDEVKAPVIVYENVKGFLSITILEYPQINHEELLWQEINQNISSSLKIMLGKYLLGKCAEYLTLKNIKSDISQIRSLASTLEKWESVVLIGMMKKLQSYLTQIKQTMKKQNLFQQEQTQLLECKEEDLDLLLNLLSTMNHLSTKDTNSLDKIKDISVAKEDMQESINLLLKNISEDLLKKAKLSIMLMDENWTIELKTYVYAMGKLNTLISIINLWKSSQNLWTEILSISISQIGNIKSKLVFPEFVQALRDIGYYCHYEVVNTKDYGVPQNRERVFLVGFLDHEAYHRFSFAPKQKLDKRLKDVLEDEANEKYYLKDSVIAQFNENTEKAGGRVGDYFINVIGLLDCKGTDQIRRVYGVYGIAATLTTMQGGNQEPKILEKRIRKLTPLECWRLQDFPDEAHHKAKASGVSNSMLYKQAGNSMSVNVLEMIFRQIELSKIVGSSGSLLDV